jgi:hypothetical protein
VIEAPEGAPCLMSWRTCEQQDKRSHTQVLLGFLEFLRKIVVEERSLGSTARAKYKHVCVFDRGPDGSCKILDWRTHGDIQETSIFLMS